MIRPDHRGVLGASFDVVGGGARRAREQWRAFGTARYHP
jgi:hypothetical protein